MGDADTNAAWLPENALPTQPGNRIEFQKINNHPAAASPYAEPLLKTGFEKDGAKLVLWQSAIAGHD
jgi:hypothetical protein